jgi:hypothetical protein
MSTAMRLEVELPEGWRGVDLPAAADADGWSAPAVAKLAARLQERGAVVALLRTGDEAVPTAICGGVFLLDELAIDGDALYVALEEDGEPVALGDLDGIPIISHVRRAPADDVTPAATVNITYFICAPSMCIVITFVAVDCGDRKGIVGEVAKIVSAARVVHSDSGCPV